MHSPQDTYLPSGPAVILSGVSKQFHAGGRTVQALKKLEAEIRSAAVTGIVGPDAAGKTTLMRLIAGLLLPDRGKISVLGRDMVSDPLAAQPSIGYMPQRFGLYEDLSLQENLNLYADLKNVPKDAREPRFQELMHMTGLGPFMRRLAGDLSGGMKQKLGLACTLVRPPRLLLLDEPTVGVDPVSRRELWQIVYRLVKEEGLTVLLSTAYLDEAERCQEVILLSHGRSLGQASPDAFSSKVAGRVFRITASGINKRTLQERLTTLPGVRDAILQGGGVRVVMDDERPPVLGEAWAHKTDARIEPVAARFEDGFISLLKGEAGPPAKGSPDRPIGAPAHPKDAEVITVRDVQRRFGDFYAVKGISFSVRHGEVFGLLGANGAGKSTTFRMLCGLLPASAGTLLVAGNDLRRAAAKARARIGYMAQHFSLYANLSVLQNLRFFSRAYNLVGSDQRRRIDWALDEFELQSFRDAVSGDLPVGYKQRLALAAALMHEPEILFLDEPTSGVDPLARREFWHRINGLARRGVTALVTTHFMEEAEYCDRLVIMAEGTLLAEGTPEGMKARYATGDRPTMEDAFIGLLETDRRRENPK